MAKAIYAAVPNNPTVELPSGYTQLQYIDGTGTQYIKTGVTASDNSKVEMGFIFESSVNSIIFGASYGYGDFSVAFYNGYLRFHAKSSWQDIAVSELNKGENHVVLTQTGFTLNGKSYTFTGTAAVRKSEICLFNVVDISGSTSMGLNPITYFKVYEGSTLLRDMTPAKNSIGAIGMYDTANNTFYTNAGSGTFVAGKAFDGKITARKTMKIYASYPVTLPSGYTKLEYIESTGTQYINTGFIPNQNTRVVCEFQMIDPSYGQWQSVFAQRNSDGATNQFTMMLRADESPSWHTAYGSQALYPAYGSSSQTSRITVDANKNTWSITGADTVTYTSAEFQAVSNLYIFACNTGGTLGHSSKMKLYSCQIYDNGTLVRNFIPMKNNSGKVGLYDTVNNKFYNNAGSGSFTAGTATDGSHSIARKVKKGYISVNGIARLFFGNTGKLIKPGTASNLSAGRSYMAAASVGNHALFAGGMTAGPIMFDNVDAYDVNLTRTTATSLSAPREFLAGASVGDYAVFAGGSGDDSLKKLNNVDAYNSSLTRSTPTALSTQRDHLAGASVGDYALFAGGEVWTTSIYGSNVVDAYNSSLTRSTPTALSETLKHLTGASVGNYAIFTGGVNSSYSASTTAIAYNSSLTRSTLTGLSLGRTHLGATSVGDYAIFAGGSTQYSGTIYANAMCTVVDAYNSSLTRSIPSPLSVARYALAAANTDKKYALFACGYVDFKNYCNIPTAVVDMYDVNLTRSVTTNAVSSRAYLAGASVGDYALFAGGHKDTTFDQTSYVDVYKVD